MPTTTATKPAIERVANGDELVGYAVYGRHGGVTRNLCLECVTEYDAPDDGNTNEHGERFIPLVRADETGCQKCGAMTRSALTNAAARAYDALGVALRAMSGSASIDELADMRQRMTDALAKLDHALALNDPPFADEGAPDAPASAPVVLDYDAACKAAATAQGLDGITARLRAEGLTVEVNQTGGFTMVTTLHLGDKWLGVTNEGTDAEPSYFVYSYDGEEDAEGTALGEEVDDMDRVVELAREWFDNAA